MSEVLDISVIIPTRNRLNVLKQTIQSACGGKGMPRQIIIVDQSDIPIRHEDIAGIVPERIQLDIAYQEKPSITAARNRGVSLAMGRIVLFMDDDVLLDEDSLIRLQKSFEDTNTALVAAPHSITLPEVRRPLAGLANLFLRKKPFRKDGYVCKGAVLGRYPNTFEGPVSTEWAMGYFFAVRRNLLEIFEISFDEKLVSYAYGEDLDFTYSFIKRARREGFSAVLNPEIYVNHLGSSEWRLPSRKTDYMYVINRYYLSYKHFNRWWMRWILIWSDIGHIFDNLAAGRNPLNILRAHWICLRKLRQLRRGIIDDELKSNL